MRRAVVAMGVVVLLAVAGVVAWGLLVVRTVPGIPGVADLPPQTVSTTPAPADLAAVTDLLTGLPGGGLDALTPGARAVAEQAEITQVLPAGTSVAVDPATWADTGTAATVEVTLTSTGGPPRLHVAALIRTSDGWQLAALTPEEPS